MESLPVIEFQDIETSDNALVIIRFDQQHVALCLSLRHGDDLEVVMTKADAQKVIEALRQSLA